MEKILIAIRYSIKQLKLEIHINIGTSKEISIKELAVTIKNKVGL